MYKMAKINYAENGKRDYHYAEEEFDNSFEKLKNEEKWKFDNNRKIVIDYIKACKRGKAKSARKNKRIGKSSLYRIIGILRLLSESWLKKDFEKATAKDWEGFYDNMEDDIIKNEYGKKFKPSSKAKNYKTLRKFLKWKFGENKYYPDFCDDWVTTEETATKIFITRSEAEKMINSASALRVKTFLMVLFDGGFRAEELANLRWVDVMKPEGRDYYKAFVRRETSKTKRERNVSLWLATDLLDSYKNSEMAKKKKEFKETDFLFDTGYQTLYRTIKRIAKKVLNKSVSVHTLRHSSATYYASIIKTYQQFCARYGWNLKSGTAQRYFHSVDDDEIAEQTKDHEIAKFKGDFERLKIENSQLQKDMEQMKEDLKEYFKKEFIQEIKAEVGIK